MATVTTDRSAVRVRDTVTCGGPSGTAWAVAAGSALTGVVADAAGEGKVGAELQATAAQRPASMTVARTMLVLRVARLAFTWSRMPVHREGSMNCSVNVP